MRCAVVELCLTQRANPNLSGSKPKSCATGQPYGTVRSVGPVRGGLGYRWLVTPTEPYPSRRSGLDYLGSNSCTLFINNYYLDINNIDKTQNYIKIAFFKKISFSFFIFACSQTVPYRYLIVILVKVASCSCVLSFVASAR